MRTLRYSRPSGHDCMARLSRLAHPTTLCPELFFFIFFLFCCHRSLDGAAGPSSPVSTHSPRLPKGTVVLFISPSFLPKQRRHLHRDTKHVPLCIIILTNKGLRGIFQKWEVEGWGWKKGEGDYFGARKTFIQILPLLCAACVTVDKLLHTLRPTFSSIK